MLKKNDDITLEITSLSSLGSGVGHFEKMAVFVEGAVTGDKINAHKIKLKIPNPKNPRTLIPI